MHFWQCLYNHSPTLSRIVPVENSTHGSKLDEGDPHPIELHIIAICQGTPYIVSWYLIAMN